MEKLKNFLISISIILGIIGYLYYTATKDFEWAEGVIERNPAGIIISESTNGISLLNPWTWKKRPITKISMMNKFCYGIYNDLYYAHVVTYAIDEASNSRLFVIDTTNKEFARVFVDPHDSISPIPEKLLENLEWNLMSRDNWDYFKNVISYIKPKYIRDAFGFYYKIDEQLKIGSYRINYAIGEEIENLINLEPYTLTVSDYELIYKEMNEWAKEKGYEQEILVNPQTIKYKSTFYSSKLVDFYEILLNENMSKFFVFSDLNSNSSNSPKHIQILNMDANNSFPFAFSNIAVNIKGVKK